MEKLVKQLPDDFEVRLEMFEERILQSIETQTMRLFPYHIDMDDSAIDDLNNRTQNSAPDKDMNGDKSRNVQWAGGSDIQDVVTQRTPLEPPNLIV